MSAIRIKPLRDWTDGRGVITVKSGGGELHTIEREVEKNARLGTDLTPDPLITVPNKYANKKRCSCPDHEGDRWVNCAQFSADRRHVDGLQAWCKACRNRQARFAYVPKWRRGV